ncbi:hypothetical protein EDD86DRAFT_203002 [Gorgonomyces haynaldii]|nr:hypothetical protein EDD86DRAFT_203002 [Gorgonomyces haynaldii]
MVSSDLILFCGDAFGTLHLVSLQTIDIVHSQKVSGQILDMQLYKNSNWKLVLLCDQFLMELDLGSDLSQFSLNVQPRLTHLSGHGLSVFRDPFSGKELIFILSDAISVFESGSETVKIDELEFDEKIVKIEPFQHLLAFLSERGTVLLVDLLTLVPIQSCLIEDAIDIAYIDCQDEALLMVQTRENALHLLDRNLSKVLQSKPAPMLSLVKGSQSYCAVGQHDNELTLYELQTASVFRKIMQSIEIGDLSTALDHASQHEIAPDVVYKLQLEHLSKQDHQAIYETLEKIQDPGFVVDYCLSFESQDLEILNQFIQLGVKRDPLNLHMTKKQSYFGLYYRLFKFGSKWLKETQFKLSDFQQSNIVQDLKECLSLGDFESSLFILKSQIGQAQVLQDLQVVLESFCPRWSIDRQLLVLDCFKPFLDTPSRICVCKFLVDKALLLEQTQGPEQALKLLNWIESSQLTLKSLTPNDKLQSLLKKQQDCFTDSEIYQESVEIKKLLLEVNHLAKTHEFYISLHDYEQTTPSNIAMGMLDRTLATSLLEQQVQDHLIPWLQRHHLSLNQVLHDYCLVLIQKYNEPRIMEIMRLVSHQETRAQIVLEMTKHTPVPWTDTLEQKIQECIQDPDLKSNEELKEQYKILKLKNLVLNYGIKNVNLSDPLLVKRLVRHILRQSDPKAVQDALEFQACFHFLSIQDIYLTRTQFLIDSKDPQFLAFVESKIVDDFVMDQVLEWIQLRLGFTLDFEHLTWCGFTISRVYRKQNTFSSLYHLKKEFGIVLLNQDQEHKRSLLHKYIQGNGISFRLGELLGLNVMETYSQALHHLAKQGDLQELMSLLNEMKRKWPNEDLSEMLQAPIEQLEERLNLDDNILLMSHCLLEMATVSVFYSPKSELETRLKAFQYYELFLRLVQESDKGEYQQSITQKMKRSLFSKPIGLVLKFSESNLELLKVKKQSRKGKGRSNLSCLLELCRQCLDYRLFSTGYCLNVLLSHERYLKGSDIDTDEQEQLRAKALKNMLQQQLNSQRIDYKLSLCCILSLDTDQAFSAFKEGMSGTMNEYDRLQKIASIGAVAGSVWNQRSFQVHCQQLAQNARWWQELKILQIPFEESQFQGEHLKKLLPQLLLKTEDLQTGLEFCDQYNIPHDDCLLEYIEQQFLKNDHKVQEALDLVTNKQRLIQFLAKDMLEKLESYQDLTYLYQLLLKIDPQQEYKKRLALLDLLDGIDLSFHQLLKEPLDLLKSNIHPRNLTKILGLCTVLELPTDPLYIQLIQKTVERISRDKENDLGFGDMRAWIAKLKSNEQAVQTAVYVGGRFPCGPDRIQAYKMAHFNADRWVKSLKPGPELQKAERALGRISQLLVLTETENLLQDNHLFDLQALAKNPTELIAQLYLKSVDCEHIVQNVARRYKLDLDKVKNTILQKWLVQEQSDDLSHCIIKMYQNERLQCKKILLSCAYAHNLKITTRTRICALSTFCLLAEPDSDELTQCNKYLKLLLYLLDFEQLKISQSLSEFEKCDKEALVKSLWLTHRDQTLALQLMAKLLMDYQIQDPTLSENIFDALYQHNQFAFLVESGLKTQSTRLPLYLKQWMTQQLQSKESIEEYLDLLMHPSISTSLKQFSDLFSQHLDQTQAMKGFYLTNPHFESDLKHLLLSNNLSIESVFECEGDSLLDPIVFPIAFEIVNQTRQFEKIVRYRERFGRFVILEDKASELLKYLLAKSPTDAHRLLQVYFKTRNEQVPHEAQLARYNELHGTDFTE